MKSWTSTIMQWMFWRKFEWVRFCKNMLWQKCCKKRTCSRKMFWRKDKLFFWLKKLKKGMFEKDEKIKWKKSFVKSFDRKLAPLASSEYSSAWNFEKGNVSEGRVNKIVKIFAKMGNWIFSLQHSLAKNVEEGTYSQKMLWRTEKRLFWLKNAEKGNVREGRKK